MKFKNQSPSERIKKFHENYKKWHAMRKIVEFVEFDMDIFRKHKSVLDFEYIRIFDGVRDNGNLVWQDDDEMYPKYYDYFFITYPVHGHPKSRAYQYYHIDPKKKNPEYLTPEALQAKALFLLLEMGWLTTFKLLDRFGNVGLDFLTGESYDSKFVSNFRSFVEQFPQLVDAEDYGLAEKTVLARSKTLAKINEFDRKFHEYYVKNYLEKIGLKKGFRVYILGKPDMKDPYKLIWKHVFFEDFSYRGNIQLVVAKKEKSFMELPNFMELPIDTVYVLNPEEFKGEQSIAKTYPVSDAWNRFARENIELTKAAYPSYAELLLQDDEYEDKQKKLKILALKAEARLRIMKMELELLKK